MNEEYIRQRISIFSGVDLNPIVDKDVAEVLKTKFGIYLPQRASFDDSLKATISDHEIIGLIIKYRSMIRT